MSKISCKKCGIECELPYCVQPLPKIEGKPWYPYATEYRCQHCGTKLRETVYD